MNNLKIYKKYDFNTVSNRLIQFEEFIKLKSHHIQQINPNILKKGYAIIRDKEEKIIKIQRMPNTIGSYNRDD